MATASAGEVDELVRAALLKLATGGADALKLKYKAGADDGLFVDSKPGKLAIERATTGDAPLIRTEKRGTPLFGLLTAAGVAKASECVPVEEAGEALLRLSDAKGEAERTKFLEEVYGHLGGRSAEVGQAFAAAAERRNRQAFEREQRAKTERLRGVVIEREAARDELRGRVTLLDTEIEGLKKLQRDIEGATPPAAEKPEPTNRNAPEPKPRPVPDDGEAPRLRAEVARLKGELEAAKAAPKPPGGEPKTTPPPAPKDAKEFVRDQAERLVAVWNEQAGHSEPAGRALETALGTMRAVERIGSVGAAVAFNPRYHLCQQPISTGAAATVARCGWKLHEGEGREYVLLKATVTPGG